MRGLWVAELGSGGECYSCAGCCCANDNRFQLGDLVSCLTSQLAHFFAARCTTVATSAIV